MGSWGSACRSSAYCFGGRRLHFKLHPVQDGLPHGFGSCLERGRWILFVVSCCSVSTIGMCMSPNQLCFGWVTVTFAAGSCSCSQELPNSRSFPEGSEAVARVSPTVRESDMHGETNLTQYEFVHSTPFGPRSFSDKGILQITASQVFNMMSLITYYTDSRTVIFAIALCEYYTLFYNFAFLQQNRQTLNRYIKTYKHQK